MPADTVSSSTVSSGCLAVQTAACSDRHVTAIAERIRALRDELGLTQEKVAAAGGLSRTEVVKLEGGQNQAKSERMRSALTKAFGVNRDDLAAYLDGELDLQTVMRRRGMARPIDTEELPVALVAVLQSEEGRTWGATTLGALRGAATASREPRTEQQWSTLGRAIELGAMASSIRVVDDDPVERRKAKKKTPRKHP